MTDANHASVKWIFWRLCVSKVFSDACTMKTEVSCQAAKPAKM